MIGLLAAITLASAKPIPAEPSAYFLDDEPVVQVVCEKWVGTAFYVGDGTYYTARHVVRDDHKKIVKCEILGKPITVLQVGDKHDYAMFKAKVWLPFREIISCDGFKEGRTYYAQGYAAGRPWIVTQRLRGSAFHTDYIVDDGKNAKPVGGAEVRGSTTEGQSGGPVVDDDGVVVGIVSAGAEGGETAQQFVSMSDLPICQTGDARPGIGG